MAFYQLPPEMRVSQVSRIMRESLVRFDPQYTARQIITLYERVLKRPLTHGIAGPCDATEGKKAA